MRLTVWDADPRVAEEKPRLAEKVIQGRDFIRMPDNTKAADAWVGSLPSHVYPSQGMVRPQLLGHCLSRHLKTRQLSREAD